MDSAEYAKATVRIRAELSHYGRVAVEVNERQYEVIAVPSNTGSPTPQA